MTFYIPGKVQYYLGDLLPGRNKEEVRLMGLAGPQIMYLLNTL